VDDFTMKTQPISRDTAPSPPAQVNGLAVAQAPILRRLHWSDQPAARLEQLLDREWLVANGLGGYASGSLGGVPTRGFHGLLMAALPAPLGRVLLVGPVLETLHLPDGTIARLGCVEHPTDRLLLEDARHLNEFFLENGLPVWRYKINDAVIERRVWMLHALNTALVRYRLLQGAGPVRIELHPGVHFRFSDTAVSTPLPAPFRLSVEDNRVEVQAAGELPPLRLTALGEQVRFTSEARTQTDVFYRVEQARGYAASGDMYCPGTFTASLTTSEPVTFVATAESWETLDALPPEHAETAEGERRHRLLALAPPSLREGVSAELVLAADQFLILPASRLKEATRLRAAGDEARTVIAGYPWFTDWGRDTMISLEGLTLTTGRYAEAGFIFRTFVQHVRDGLIPNYFPDGKTSGVYHTADATLWLFHALHRYLEVSHDREMLHLVLPKLVDIIEHHLRGTKFGIGVDPSDGLLRQGETGYQLTWMDAKVGDWVVTPRRGKAVEINALWYNALCLLRAWLKEEPSPSELDLTPHIDRARASFNKRFWNPVTGCLFDVVDGEGGDDPAGRPNQVLAISLPHPILEPSRWRAVLGVVRDKLLTPVGLRSLSPDNPSYQPRYDGTLRMRDAAYHQGTVWTWLLGPFVDAWLKVHPEDRVGARALLAGLEPHLNEAGVGTISEIFDAEEPWRPRGCIAQAWSVAEVLRCWALTEEPRASP
jgi:predicted glycogen debranching enzyme